MNNKFFVSKTGGLFLFLVLLLFSFSFVSATTIGKDNSIGVKLNQPVAGVSVNNNSLSVNNSAYLEGYTWLTNPYFADWSSTFNATYNTWAYNQSDNLGNHVATQDLNMSNKNIIQLGDISTTQTDILINSSSANSFTIQEVNDGRYFMRTSSQYDAIGFLSGTPSTLWGFNIAIYAKADEYDSSGTNGQGVRVASASGANMKNTSISSKAGKGGTLSFVAGNGGTYNLIGDSADLNYTGGDGGTVSFSGGDGGSSTMGGPPSGDYMIGGAGSTFTMDGGNGGGTSYSRYAYGGNGGDFVLAGGKGGTAYNPSVYGQTGNGGSFTLKGGQSGLLTKEAGVNGSSGTPGNINLQVGDNQADTAWGSINFMKNAAGTFGIMSWINTTWNFWFDGDVNVTQNLIVGGNATYNSYVKITANATAMICDANTEGSLYYDSATKKHYGCNVTAWQPLY